MEIITNLFKFVISRSYIKFIRELFPSIIENSNDPNFGEAWGFETSDIVKIEGDLENIS